MTTPLDRFAARLRRVERELLARKSPQLANSSVEDGALRVNAADGTETMVIGKQYDGTSAAATVTGPPPPQPSAPSSRPSVSGIVAIWDGTFVDALVAPQNFSRVEVHVGPAGGFDASSATYLRDTIESPRGGEIVVPLDTLDQVSIILVARSLSGGRSVQSAATLETPGVQVRLATAPDGNRVEVYGEETRGVVAFYPEWPPDRPGYIYSDGDPSTGGTLTAEPPTMVPGAPTPSLDLTSGNDSSSGSTASLAADRILLQAGSVELSSLLFLARGLGISGVTFGTFSGTTLSDGTLAVPHSLGVIPAVVICQIRSTGTGFRVAGTHTYGSASFGTTIRNGDTNAAAAFTTVEVNYIAISQA